MDSDGAGRVTGTSWSAGSRGSAGFTRRSWSTGSRSVRLDRPERKVRRGQLVRYGPQGPQGPKGFPAVKSAPWIPDTSTTQATAVTLSSMATRTQWRLHRNGANSGALPGTDDTWIGSPFWGYNPPTTQVTGTPSIPAIWASFGSFRPRSRTTSGWWPMDGCFPSTPTGSSSICWVQTSEEMAIALW